MEQKFNMTPIQHFFVLFKKDLQNPNKELCLRYFENFYERHQLCVRKIKENKKLVLNSGIKIS